MTAMIRAMSDYASERVDGVAAALDAGLSDGGRDLNGPCPVHGGDNPTALHLYKDGYSRKGNWFCATRACEGHFGRDLFGFVRGVLSHRGFGWRERGDRAVGPGETLRWLGDALGVDPRSLLDASAERDRSDEINRWAGRVSRFSPAPRPIADRGWTRREVRAGLRIPSEYFLSRGFSPEVLDRYDVGDSTRPGTPLSGRAVVPVYDLPGERAVGFAARAAAEGVSPKWHNHGFASGATLFNLWKARDAVLRRKRAVLVEGPGDCLRLVQAGFDDALAVFGTKLTDAQQILLETLGVLELVPLFDWDDAGRKAVKDLKREVGRSFRVTVPDWNPPAGKDVGGCTPGELQTLREVLCPT